MSAPAAACEVQGGKASPSLVLKVSAWEELHNGIASPGLCGKPGLARSRLSKPDCSW